MDVLARQIRELGPEQLFEVFLGDGGHLDDHKAGGEGFVQFPSARVAVVHGGNETGLLGQRDALVAGHIDGAAEIQHRVEDSQRLVLCHVDLIQHAKAAALSTAVDRAGPEFDGTALKGVHADEGGRVHIHMERDIPCRAAKGGGQILRQHIFAGGLAAGQQQVLAAEQGGQCLLPDIFSIVSKGRLRHTGSQSLGQRVGGTIFIDGQQQIRADALLL